MTTDAGRPVGGPAQDGPVGGDAAAEGAPGGGGFEAADPAAIGWGTAFGSGYLLQREIGVGGMGTVWRGWSTAGQHAVAVKVLHPHLSADRGVVARFLREGDVLKRLEHPNLVKVRDLVIEGGRLGLVMDLVEGGDLHKRRKRLGTLPAAEVARIGAQAAGALAAAHTLGVAHLDLKPANILISPRPRPDAAAPAPGGGSGEDRDDACDYDVRLTDFGISRMVDSPDQATTTTTYGTPDYMAPETGLTGSTGPACDLYALGITLYEILVGRTPYGGGNALTVLARHIERMPRRLRTIPDPLWEVIAACTAAEPSARPEAAGVADYLAAAWPGLAGIPAAEPLPSDAGFEATSELRRSSADAATVAVPWLAAVAAANRAPAAETAEAEPAGREDAPGEPDEPKSRAGDEAFAAAMRKPPPEGPFSTAPTRPDVHERQDSPVPALSGAARRRAALIGAPVLVSAVVGVLFASGVFADGPPASGKAGARVSVAQGPSGQSGQSGTAVGPAGTTGVATSSVSKGSKPAAGGASSASAAPGTSSAQGDGNAAAGGSSTAVVETTTDTTGAGAASSPGSPGSVSKSASPPATDTGWVCRAGGFKVDGALSEDPCVRDDDGTLMLEGELKGTYDSPVVVVVRVDYGGVYSSANVSQSVTPAGLDGKTFVYKVIIGSWAPGEQITCQENIDPASDASDYEYTSNSADIRTS